MKVGLVLEGGAMRGLYTAGILDVFMEQGITVDIAVGTSAGALFGVNFLSKQKGRAIRYNKRFNGDPRYMGLRVLLKEGNYFGNFAYHDVPFELDPFDDGAYKASGVPFYAVATEMESGNPEYILVKSVFEQMDVLRASGSMPMVSTPVEIDGKLYLDGGISDSIAFEWMETQGVDKMIVILTQDRAYRKKPMAKVMTWPYKRKYPKIYERLQHRHESYNARVERLNAFEAAGKAFVFRPELPLPIGRIEKDPAKLQEAYDIGVRDAKRLMPELLKYLEQ